MNIDRCTSNLGADAGMSLRRTAASRTESLGNLEALPTSANVATIEELSDAVQQNEDVDTWVALTDRGVLICTPISGTELVFPFTWQEFCQ